MATFWRVLAGVRLGYRLAWTVLYLIGRPLALWIGLVVLFGWYGLTTFRPADAIPWAVLWALFSYGCRIAVNAVLPLPSAGRSGPLPGDAPPPPAVQAVIVTPAAPAEACPDRAGMLGRLPAEVRTLIR